MDNIVYNESEIDTDEEDLIIEESAINNLKTNFTFEDFWDYGVFWVSFGTKVLFTFRVILEVLSHFWQCCFFSVF